jgi:DNA polymerase III subunit alpha
MSFTHTHTHTEYSLLDGAIRCEELAKHIKAIGQTSVCITDHGNLHGVVDFYKSCIAENIKPIIGTEAYITEDPPEAEQKNRDNLHLVLLAKNNEGYKELLQLTTQANAENFYYKPRIWFNRLREVSPRGNLIALTACLGGVVARHWQPESSEKAAEQFLRYRDVFGSNFFAEIQHNDDPRQAPYNKFLIELANRHGVGVVVTTDAHFLTRDDYDLHSLMMSMQLRTTFAEYMQDDSMKYGPGFYVKNEKEMQAIADMYKVPEATTNTSIIANLCNVSIELGKLHPPVFDVTKVLDYKEFLQWKKNYLENLNLESKAL